MSAKPVTLSDTVISTWFERDRAHVCLSWAEKDGSAGATIVEWWDQAYRDAIVDGFLDVRDLHGSAFAYAEQCNLLVRGAKPTTIVNDKTGVVAVHPELGVYLGWRRGGAPIWSSEATADELAKGAYVFSSEEDAAESFQRDRNDAELAARAEPGDLSPEAAVTAHQAKLGLDQDPEYVEVALGIPETSNATTSRVSLKACEEAGVTVRLPEAPAVAPSLR